jgi:hypothetical protein
LHWCTSRPEDQQNRTEDPEISHETTTIWFSTKVPKTSIGEKTASLTNGVGKTGYPQ